MEQHSKLPWKEIINNFCYSNTRVLLICICAGIAIIMCATFTIKDISKDEIAAIWVCAFLVVISSIMLCVYIKKAKNLKRMIIHENYLCIILLALFFIVTLNAGLFIGNFFGYLTKIYFHGKQF